MSFIADLFLYVGALHDLTIFSSFKKELVASGFPQVLCSLFGVYSAAVYV